MAGVLPGEAKDAGRLVRFGYAALSAESDSMLFRAGESFPIHEFHHWDSTVNGTALAAKKPVGGAAWRCGFVNEHFYALRICTGRVRPCRSALPPRLKITGETMTETELAALCAAITPPDEAARAAAHAHWASLAKPLGGLGGLETTIEDAAALTGSAKLDISRRAVLVLCADNGVVAQASARPTAA